MLGFGYFQADTAIVAQGAASAARQFYFTFRGYPKGTLLELT